MAKAVIKCETVDDSEGGFCLVITASGLSHRECTAMGVALEASVRDAFVAATQKRRKAGSHIKNLKTGELTPVEKLS